MKQENPNHISAKDYIVVAEAILQDRGFNYEESSTLAPKTYRISQVNDQVHDYYDLEISIKGKSKQEVKVEVVTLPSGVSLYRIKVFGKNPEEYLGRNRDEFKYELGEALRNYAVGARASSNLVESFLRSYK